MAEQKSLWDWCNVEGSHGWQFWEERGGILGAFPDGAESITEESVMEYGKKLELTLPPEGLSDIEEGISELREYYAEALELTEEHRRVPEFTFVDLFAGIGGLRRGFEAQGGECVFSCERDKFARKTYEANYPDGLPIAEDITDVDPADVPDHDVLLAGFPCQPFSISGVSKKNALGHAHGFDCETQGTLFFNIEKIIAAKRPKAFLLENVKNLLSHDKGRTFKVIANTLREKLGYTIHYKVVDALGFVPQSRKRIFIVGFRENAPFSWDDLRLPAPDSLTMGSVMLPDCLVEDRYILSDKMWSYLQAYKAKHKKAGNGFGYGMVTRGDTSRTLSARYYKDGSEILVSRGEGRNPRRLTPRECGALMGFPADLKLPVSNTQAYRQFGNSVVVPLVTEIARIMKPTIDLLFDAEALDKS